MKKQLTKAQIAKRAYMYAYDHSEVGRARRRRYNTSSKGKERNNRVRAKRATEPQYADYRAFKLVWDRRNHFFRYGVLRDEAISRFPWLRNNLTARQVFARATGISISERGELQPIDFTQPRRQKRETQPISAREAFEQVTGFKIGK